MNKKLLYILIGVAIISLVAQFFLFKDENMTEENIDIEYIQWSEYCDGKIYTENEKTDFCNNCTDCDWPLDMMIHFDQADYVRKTGGEIHCYFVIDGINYYHEKGRYFGIENQSFFTWEKLNAKEGHNIELCCGIERETVLSKLFGIEKKWPQACKSGEVGPRC